MEDSGTWAGKVPRYCFTKGGWLYFQKRYRGTRYVAAFGFRDTPENRSKADTIAKHVVGAMALGCFDPESYPFLANKVVDAERRTPTLATFVEDWLDRQRGLRPSTQRNYAWMLRKHVLPSFGTHRVDQITKPNVERWLIRKSDGRTRQLANEALRRLKQVMKDAEGDYDFTSRVHLVKPLRNFDPNAEPLPIYSMDEASKLYFVMGARMRTMMLCSLLGGLRTGEVIALQRTDILFEQNEIFVRATMNELGELVAPKTAAGRRRVPMHPTLREHLQVHLLGHSHPFVFVSQRGNPYYHRQSFAKEFKNAVHKARVRDLRWYAFRHMYASLRYACSDLNPVSIADDMGHTKPSMGLDIYARALPHQGCRFDEVVFPLICRNTTQAA